MEKITDELIKPFYAIRKWKWLLNKLIEKKGEDVRESIIKLLAYQSIFYDERTGEIGRIGLSLYELSNKSTFGTEKSLPNYLRLNKKYSHSNINKKVIPEMLNSKLIIGIKDKYISHAKKPIPIYNLTFNGIIFALLFANENFDHTEKIIQNHTDFMDYYKIPCEKNNPGYLLKNFSKLDPQEQKQYIESYFEFLHMNVEVKALEEALRFQYLMVDPEHAFYYQFFLIPAFLSSDKEILDISRKCWLGSQEVFRNSLRNVITNHLKAFDLFIEKLDLPLGQKVTILGEYRERGTNSLLLWIDKDINQFMREEVFKKRLNLSTEKIRMIYNRSLHWAALQFIELTKSNKKEDKELLEEIISFVDVERKNTP